MNELLRTSKYRWGIDHFEDANLFDTRLSKQGIVDAQLLNARIASKDAIIGDMDRVKLVVSSPLTRALQTSEYAFANHLPLDRFPRLVLPLAAERLYMSSEVGRSKEELAAEFPNWNYELVGSGSWWYTHPPHETYNEWRPKGKYAVPGEPSDAFAKRMRALKSWLEQREEDVICVVCHWGVVRALSGIEFENCEVRSFPLGTLLDEPLVD
jgi:glucosyl-3-phosphoglycerate phosphatase